MSFTGDPITGREAADMERVLRADLDAARAFAARMATVPINRLAMQKLVINQAVDAMGLMNTQPLASIFDGIPRHSPRGQAFKAWAETQGWKQAADEREGGIWDRTANAPFPPPTARRVAGIDARGSAPPADSCAACAGSLLISPRRWHNPTAGLGV
jgi:enoyl-CoA hydratase